MLASTRESGGGIYVYIFQALTFMYFLKHFIGQFFGSFKKQSARLILYVLLQMFNIFVVGETKM